MFKKMINDLKEKRKEKKEFLKNEKERQKYNRWINSLTQEERMKYSIFHEEFLFKLKNISTLEGCGNDYADYEFYETMSPEDKEGIEPFEGLRVSLNWPGEGIIYVSYEELLNLMEEYKGTYIENHPDKKEIVEQYIEEYKKKANLK